MIARGNGASVTDEWRVNSPAARHHGSAGTSMKFRTIAAISLIWAAPLVHAQEGPSAEITQRAVERRAVEAVIWGMPAVNYDLMLQEMLDATDGERTRSSTGAGRSTG